MSSSSGGTINYVVRRMVVTTPTRTDRNARRWLRTKEALKVWLNGSVPSTYRAHYTHMVVSLRLRLRWRMSLALNGTNKVFYSDRDARRRSIFGGLLVRRVLLRKPIINVCGHLTIQTHVYVVLLSQKYIHKNSRISSRLVIKYNNRQTTLFC